MILLDAAGRVVQADLPDSRADVFRYDGVPYRFVGLDGGSGQRVYQAAG
jgi:hypothetical protein